MTREETKKCIEVMQAYVDGKEITFKQFGHKTEEDEEPYWNWELCKYCIKEEPKPFDWRGKNIQWVRNIGEIDSVHRVECMDSKGILYTRHSAGPYQMFVELDKLQKLEWSEDNATWRRFE